MHARFCFDFISPYAYVAWTQIPAIAARTGATIEPVPVLFAGLLRAHGNLGPAEIPAKRDYIIHDLLRLAAEHGIPFELPPAHPFNPLTALRVAAAAAAGQRSAIVSALYDAAWGRGQAIDTTEGVHAALTVAGIDADPLLAAAGEPAAKERLRTDTEAAVADGVFGVPTLIADGELFWGVDSLAHFERFCTGGRRCDAAVVARWRDLPAATKRRRD